MSSTNYRSIFWWLLLSGLLFLIAGLTLATLYYFILPYPLFQPLSPSTPQKIANISDIEHLRQVCQLLISMDRESKKDMLEILDNAIEIALSLALLAALSFTVNAWRLHRLLSSGDKAS